MNTHYNPFTTALIALTNPAARQFYAIQFASGLVLFSTAALFAFNLGVTASRIYHRRRIPTAPQRLLPPAKLESTPVEDPWTPEPEAPKAEPERFTTLPKTAIPTLALPGTCDVKLSDLRRRYKVMTGKSLPKRCTKSEALQIVLATI